MFSRALSIHRGIPNAVTVRLLGPAYFQRTESTVPAESKPNSLAEHRKKIEALLKEELPKPYDGPERDLVNFPRRVRPEFPSKVRFAFLPDEWFTFFYKKTGVTGPYFFGLGFVTFMVSKEWYVIENEFSTGVSILLLAYLANRQFGKGFRKYVEDDFEARLAKVNQSKEQSVKQIEDAIADEKKNVWYAEGQKILMEAKRENVQMQLETEYRKRMMTVYDQVKKRLDYHLNMHNTRRKLEQKHMVDWIVNNVVKSITPQQEKEALQKCLDDLKVMSVQGH